MIVKNKPSILATSTFIQGPESGIIENVNFPPKSDQDWVARSFVVDPAQWGQVKPKVNLHIRFVNHFNTDIRGEENWTVGYLNEQGPNGVPITTNLDDIIFSNASAGQKNIQGNFYPVVNQNNTIGWTNETEEGYYKYSPSEEDYEIYRIVAITNGTTYYLIKITNLRITSANDHLLWNSKIYFEYKAVNNSTIEWNFKNPKHQLLKGWMANK